MASLQTLVSKRRPTINIDTPQFYQDPYPTYEQLRGLSPVYQLETGGLYAISTYDAVEIAFKKRHFSSDSFSNILKPDFLPEELHRNFLFANMDGEQHQKYKRVMRAAINRTTLGAIKDPMISHATVLSRNLLTRGRCDFHKEFSIPLISSCILRFTGLEAYQSSEELYHYVNQSAKSCELIISDSEKAEIKKTFAFQKAKYRELLEGRKNNRVENDFLTIMMAQRVDEKPLSDDQLIAALDLFVIASIFNPSHLLTNAVKLFTEQPHIMNTLRNDFSNLINNFTHELIRYCSPTHNIIRRVKKKVTLSGVKIPENAYALLMVASANRDAKIFKNADTFDMKRQNASKGLSFGYGNHKCLGVQMTFLQVRFGLIGLVTTIDEFVCQSATEIKYADSYSMPHIERLPVKAIAL